VSGSDLDRARAAGLPVDGGIGRLADAVVDTDLRVDPLTQQRLDLLEKGTATSGFALDDMDCWLGAHDRRFVGRGSFDGDAVEASAAGEDGAVIVRDDLIAYDPGGHPEALLAAPSAGGGDRSGDARGGEDGDDAGAIPPELTAALESLDRHEAVTFDVIATGDEQDAAWVGIGLARGDDRWELMGVWSFADADLASDEHDDVVAAIDEGTVGDMVIGDPDALVHKEGTTLWMRAPLRDEASGWTEPIAIFDPVLTVVADFTDGN
jgi:hypothetical protein